jgi:bifunctional pyridoxal-dependent enzyme with beta-cystathionase and maltose regulon repressor activities
MKTIKEINQEIDELINRAKTEADKKKITSKVVWLRQCIRYLETNPNQEYIKRTINELELLIVNKKQQYKTWIDLNAGKFDNPEKKYESIMDFAGMKAKIKTLKYLL